MFIWASHKLGLFCILAVILVNCFVTCLSLILDVQLYDSGIGKDKSLALEPKFRAKNKIIFSFQMLQTRFNPPQADVAISLPFVNSK